MLRGLLLGLSVFAADAAWGNLPQAEPGLATAERPNLPLLAIEARERGEGSEAVRLQRLAVEEVDRLFPEMFRSRAERRNLLGFLYFENGQCREALAPFKEAERLVSESAPLLDTATLRSEWYGEMLWAQLGQIQVHRCIRDFRAALSAAELALANFERVPFGWSIKALIHNEIALVYRDSGDLDAALAAVERGLAGLDTAPESVRLQTVPQLRETRNEIRRVGAAARSGARPDAPSP